MGWSGGSGGSGGKQIEASRSFTDAELGIIGRAADYGTAKRLLEQLEAPGSQLTTEEERRGRADIAATLMENRGGDRLTPEQERLGELIGSRDLKEIEAEAERRRRELEQGKP